MKENFSLILICIFCLSVTVSRIASPIHFADTYIRPTSTATISCAPNMQTEFAPATNIKTAVAYTGAIITKPVNNVATINGLKKWSQPNTWANGAVPVAGDSVIIPMDAAVLLDQSVDVQAITIMGMLVVDITKPNIAISANNIIVMNDVGQTNKAYLQWGTPQAPYRGKGIITLKGNNTLQNIMGLGTKVLGAMNNGEIQLHGTVKKSWTQLGVTASVNTNSITLAEPTDWEKGDEIVISSTDFNMNQAEQRTITGVSDDKKTFTLNTALAYSHFGKLQNYTHGSNPNIKWEVDERAEVGLLSKSITIQGDESSVTSNFGGHVMIMATGKANISNVEFTRMGQRAILGRYPFHWHNITNGYGAGQYITNSSVHHTYNRAITVHATNDVSVTNNVAYDNLGHAYFFEDGNEENVTMTGNLGLVTRRPLGKYALLPSDTTNERNNSGPSTFWLTNPRNNVSGNHAAGSDGSGFWYSPFNNPNGIRYVSSYQPLNFAIPNGFIDNSVAHSSRHGIIIGAGIAANDKSELPNQNQGVNVPVNSKPTFKNLLLFKNALGLYSRTMSESSQESYYQNIIFADNRVGDASTWRTYYDSILWVVSSENYSNNYYYLNVGGDVTAAHIVYDGPVITTNSHFAGTTLAGQSMFDQWGANKKYTGHTFSNTTVEAGSYKINYRNSATDAVNPVWFLASVRDLDGKLTGRVGASITKNHPYLTLPSSIGVTGNGAITSMKYGYIEATGSDHLSVQEALANPSIPDRPNATFIRSDELGQYDDKSAIQGYPMTTFIDTLASRYMLQARIPARTRWNIYSMSANETIVVEFPNCPATLKVYTGNQVDSDPGGGTGFKEITKVANLLTLKTTDATVWTWENNTAYVKFKAPAGSNFTFDKIINSIFLCLYGNCADGVNNNLVVSDFDRLDTRGSLSRVSGTVNFSATPTYSSTLNGSNFYNVTNNGDATDGCVEYRLNMDMQSWVNVDTLAINVSGSTTSAVYIEDKSDDRSLLGLFSLRDGYQIFRLSGLPASKRDQVKAIIIRTCESSLNGAEDKRIYLSDIVLGTPPPIVLPVNLLTFTGKNTMHDGIQLNWATATETNNDYFEVQHSLNGIDFTKIGIVNGNGNSSQNINYNFIHSQPLNGNNYYRLQQFDKNGNTQLSPIILVNRALQANNVQVYFTGSSISYNITTSTNASATIQLHDVAGRQLQSKKLSLQTGSNNGNIPTSTLFSGAYFLSVTVNGETTVKHFFK